MARNVYKQFKSLFTWDKAWKRQYLLKHQESRHFSRCSSLNAFIFNDVDFSTRLMAQWKCIWQLFLITIFPFASFYSSCLSPTPLCIFFPCRLHRLCLFERIPAIIFPSWHVSNANVSDCETHNVMMSELFAVIRAIISVEMTCTYNERWKLSYPGLKCRSSQGLLITRFTF